MQISSAATAGQADAHFRAVCRALVAETLEFSDFLIKVSSGISLTFFLYPFDIERKKKRPLRNKRLNGLE